jgi:uncharacterized protein (DUF58 family)
MEMAVRLAEPVLLEKLGSLEFRARRLVEGTLSGMHRSRLSGDNVEFAGHKEYVPGDDVKDIDWKAYARLDRYYLKESLDETNLTAWLALDCSGSMDYPEAGIKKSDCAALLAAALAWMLLDQGDSVGLYAFPAGRALLPPRSSRPYFTELAAAIESAAPRGAASLRDTAYEIAGAAKRRGLVVLFSDLLDPDPDALPAVTQLARRGHDVAVFQILDRTEIDFPFSGLTLFCDAESDGQLQADPGAMAESYRREFGSFLDGVRTRFVDAGVDHQLVLTDTPPETVLREFLERRHARKKGKG